MKNNENSNGGTINQPIPEISRYRTSSNSVQPSTDIKFLYNFTKQINQKSTRSTTRLKKKEAPRPSHRSHCQFNSTLSLRPNPFPIQPDQKTFPADVIPGNSSWFGSMPNRVRPISFASPFHRFRGEEKQQRFILLLRIRITRYRIHRQTGSIGSGSFVRKRERDGWLRSSCRVVAGSGWRAETRGGGNEERQIEMAATSADRRGNAVAKVGWACGIGANYCHYVRTEPALCPFAMVHTRYPWNEARLKPHSCWRLRLGWRGCPYLRGIANLQRVLERGRNSNLFFFFFFFFGWFASLPSIEKVSHRSSQNWVSIEVEVYDLFEY